MARTLSKRVLEDIRFRNDIAEVVGSYFALKHTGGTFKALCPFHKEKTPSFTVNPQRQIFHCFGCGAGGDVFKFVQQYEGVDFMTAVRMLAQRAGIPLEFDEEGQEGERVDKEALYRIHEEAARFYQRCLQQMPSAQPAREYLQKRRLPAEIAEDFLIGYAPDRWDAILLWGRKHKFAVEQLETAGLVVKRGEGPGAGRHYDRFRNRVMFPIRDSQGRVIGFSGRTLEAKPTAAKYVNSPETPIFKKSRVLYALDRARRQIVDTHEAIVCEGQIDVIRCHQAGFTAAVAAQGTAFTAEHAQILHRFADSVVIVFDSDNAGQEAAVKAAATFMEAGLACRVGALPEGEDPDSFILKAGADGFRAVLEQAESVVGFQIRTLSARNNPRSEVGVMRIADAVLQTVARSPNPVQRATLTEQVAETMRLPLADVQSRLRHWMRRTRGAPEAQAESGATADASPAPRPAEEIALCEHLVHAVEDAPEVMGLVRDYLPLRLLSDPLCRRFVAAALAAATQGVAIEAALREQADPAGELQTFAAAIVSAPSKTRGIRTGTGTVREIEFKRSQAVQDVILAIWTRELKTERARLTEAEAPRRSQLTRDLHHLRRWETGAAVIDLVKEE